MVNQRHRNSGNNPDFDLDDYIKEKSNEIPGQDTFEEEINYPKPTTRRNLVAILIFTTLAGFWFLTGGPASIFLFDDDGVNIEVNVPEIEVPELRNFVAPPPPALSQINTTYLDYLQQINETFPNQFSGSAVQGLYSGGVPIEYISSLNDAGYLDDFSYSAIIGLFNGGVPTEYLNQMEAAGYLDDFSYSAIIGLYNGGVPTQYLDQMKEAGFLDDFSYSAVIGMFNGNVPTSYLNSLQSSGYLETYSYSGIIGLYNSGVPVEFLKILDERDLLDDMSYSEVIRAYNADN